MSPCGRISYRCTMPGCTEERRSDRALTAHMKKAHFIKDEESGLWLCPFPGACYPDDLERLHEQYTTNQPTANLPQHIAAKHTHAPYYDCPTCGKAFGGASWRSRHRCPGHPYSEPKEETKKDRKKPSKRDKENQPEHAINQEELREFVSRSSSAPVRRSRLSTRNAKASNNAAPSDPQSHAFEAPAYQYPPTTQNQFPAQPQTQFWEYTPHTVPNIPADYGAPALAANFAAWAFYPTLQYTLPFPETAYHVVNPYLPAEAAFYNPFDDITNVPVVPANGPVDEWDYGTYSPDILDAPLNLLPPPGPGYPVLDDNAVAAVFDELYAQSPLLPYIAPPAYDYIGLDYASQPAVASNPDLATTLDAFLGLPPYSPPPSSPAPPATTSPTSLPASIRVPLPEPPESVGLAPDAPLDFRRSAPPSPSFASSTDGSDFGGPLELLAATPSHTVDELPLKLEDVFDESTLGVSLGDLSTLGMF